MRQVPVDAKSLDWPRKVANAINSLLVRQAEIGSVTDQLGNLSEYADDTAAAAGGVEVGGFYRTASTIKVRVA